MRDASEGNTQKRDRIQRGEWKFRDIEPCQGFQRARTRRRNVYTILLMGVERGGETKERKEGGKIFERRQCNVTATVSNILRGFRKNKRAPPVGHFRLISFLGKIKSNSGAVVRT